MRRQRYFSKADKLTLRRLICEKTGYGYLGTAVLSQAFRRSSYCAEEGGKSNEMLEFIGDQVLSYYAVKIIAQRCGAMNGDGDYTFRVRQNRFSALKQELLCNEAFAKIIDDWGVADYLIVGRDDEKNEVHKQTKVKADLFEAIIGAIVVACKWDPEVLEKVVNKALNLDERIKAIIQEDSQSIQFDMDNAVTKLKELAEQEWCSKPWYRIVELGRDKNGDPIWSCGCQTDTDTAFANVLVYASSKKNAKKAAAYCALCELFEVANKYAPCQSQHEWTYKDGKLLPGYPKFSWEKDNDETVS